MSMVDYREIRRRLMNPAGGRDSSELEIIAVPAVRRAKLDQLAREDAARAVEAEIQRRELTKAIAAKALQRAQEQLEAWKSAQRAFALNLGNTPPSRLTMNHVVAEVCIRYQIQEADLCSKRRHAAVVMPRQIAMYLCKAITLRSLPEIGRRFGKDHTTVLHAVRKIRILVENYPHLAAEIEDIKKTLGAA